MGVMYRDVRICGHHRKNASVTYKYYDTRANVKVGQVWLQRYKSVFFLDFPIPNFREHLILMQTREGGVFKGVRGGMVNFKWP